MNLPERSPNVHAAAAAELEDAALCYDQRQPGLADTFLDAVSDQVEHIRRLPRACPRIGESPEGRPLHRGLVDRFPYSVVYTHAGETIGIIAFAHTSREPGYWIDRTLDDAS